MPDDAPPARAADGTMPRSLTPELVISAVLRGGVLLSAAIIALGTALFFWRALTGRGGAGAGTFPHTLSAALAGVAAGSPAAIIVLGLLVLLATPLLRIIVSVAIFARERDWLYVAITLLVLAILLLSFALGKGGA